MTKRRLTDIKMARKWALPAGIVAIGLAYLAIIQPGLASSKPTATDVKYKTSPTQHSETFSSQVKVNGTEVPTDKSGATEVNIPGGKARVEVSGGSTRITTNESRKGNSVNTQSSNVNVSINSQSTGGNSHSTTQIHGSSRSSGNSSSSTNNITIFSTDAKNHVNVSH